MYRVAICEDEAAVRADTREKCDAILTRHEVAHAITEFESAEELEKVLSESAEPFDLLLLDIQLPGKTGVELGASLRKLDDSVGIIFITGNAAYAIEGYRAQLCNYLLKPVTEKALSDALTIELKRHGKHKIIVFSERGRTARLPASDILYIESYDHGIRVHTVKEELFFYLPLSQAMELVPKGMFARCHNSFFVNLTHVVTVSGAKVTFRGGGQLPIGRTYRDEFQKIFISHFF